jgi:hypothetical protein
MGVATTTTRPVPLVLGPLDSGPLALGSLALGSLDLAPLDLRPLDLARLDLVRSDVEADLEDIAVQDYVLLALDPELARLACGSP